MKKKKPQVYFNPIDGSAPLSIYWFGGPKGDAVEANNLEGVGFFAPNGELLGVIFDEVLEKKDHQFLEFDRYQVEVEVHNGKINYSQSKVNPPKRTKPNTRNKSDKELA